MLQDSCFCRSFGSLAGCRTSKTLDARRFIRNGATLHHWLLLGIAIPLGLTGCSSLWRQNGEDPNQADALQELLQAPEAPDLIRDATAPHGMRPIEVEGVGVVNGLPGSGGPPDPSRFRDELLEEMKRHGVANPNQFLETADTALVRVRATIPAGARRGDPIDVRVLAPKVSRATDLHGGWLLDTRLRQHQMLNRAIRKSDVMAVGTGRVLTRADFTPGADESLKLEANILAGGRVQETRKLGLVLMPKYQHAKICLVDRSCNQSKILLL